MGMDFKQKMTEIVEKAKDIYFEWEEKYYHVLDKIDAKIPIYKLVDRIDAVVPSFALLLGILAIFILLGLFGLISMLLGGGQTTLIVKVVDPEGNGLGSSVITLTYGENFLDGLTDDFGETRFAGIPMNQEIELGVSAEGFDESTVYVTTFDSPEQIETITLESGAGAGITKTIRLLDDTGQPILTPLTLSFQCSNIYATPPDNVTVTDGVATITVAENCERLIASVTDSAEYQDKISIEIDKDDFQIYLQALAIGTATLTINVTNELGDPVDGVNVELYKYNELVENPAVGPVDSKLTSGGQVSFTRPAGDYIIKTYDRTRRYGDFDSGKISLLAGQTITRDVILQENIIGSIKLKIVDEDNGAGVSNALVTLRYAATEEEITQLRTDSTGYVEFGVTQDTDYKVIVEASDYALGRKSNLRVGDQTIEVEISKCTPETCGIMYVKVMDQDELVVTNATVALYQGDFLAGYSNQTSDIGGIAKFPNVSPGNFYAYAFKGPFSGKSETGRFDGGVGAPEKPNLVVPMEIGDGTLKVTVVDADNNPIPYTQVSIYDVIPNETDEGTEENLFGADFTNEEGILELDTKADKKVYVRASTEDMANYTTVAKPIVYSGVQEYLITMEPEIIDEDIEVKFKGMFVEDKLATTVAAGQDYVAKWELRVPEDKEYDEAGLHVRTGKNLIMEKDSLLIHEINVPATQILKATRFDEESGLEPGEYDVTFSDAKWVNAAWTNPLAGIYEAEAIVRVSPNATIGEQLELNYRAWAEVDGDQEFDPIDDEIDSSELYNNTYKEFFQVGVATLCDEDFCFDVTITDLEEDILESITDAYQSKIFNQYELRFTLVNNSSYKVHDNANLRIQNKDKSILLGDYDLMDAETRPIRGSWNDYESTRIQTGNLAPSKKMSGTIQFVPQRPMSGVITFTLVSDQIPIWQKNITVNTSAAQKLKIVDFEEHALAAGIENSISLRVKDATTDVDIEQGIVRVLDQRRDVLIAGQTDDKGKITLVIPAQEPGVKLKLEVEKPNYDVYEKEMIVREEILEFNPSELGIGLNSVDKQETSTRLVVKNVAAFPVRIQSISLNGNFKGLLDEQQIENYLMSNYLDFKLEDETEYNFDIRTFLSDDGKGILEREELDGEINFTIGNFGRSWSYNVPAKIVVGVGKEVDDPNCLSITRSVWEGSSQGPPIFVEFQIQNNCTVDGRPATLRNLEASFQPKQNQIGVFNLTVEQNEIELRSSYFRRIVNEVSPTQTYTGILGFTPYAGIDGVQEGDIVIRATNPLEQADQKIEVRLPTTISAINLKDCIAFDRDLVVFNKGQTGSFVISTKGCGGATKFKLKSELELSLKEFTLNDGEEKEVILSEQDDWQGQYPIFVRAQGPSQKTEQLIKVIRGRLIDPNACFKLNRYEFDIFTDPNNTNTGYDFFELTNTCVEKKASIHLDERDILNAIMQGFKWGVLGFAISGVSSLVSGTSLTDEQKVYVSNFKDECVSPMLKEYKDQVGKLSDADKKKVPSNDKAEAHFKSVCEDKAETNAKEKKFTSESDAKSQGKKDGKDYGKQKADEIKGKTSAQDLAKVAGGTATEEAAVDDASKKFNTEFVDECKRLGEIEIDEKARAAGIQASKVSTLKTTNLPRACDEYAKDNEFESASDAKKEAEEEVGDIVDDIISKISTEIAFYDDFMTLCKSNGRILATEKIAKYKVGGNAWTVTSTTRTEIDRRIDRDCDEYAKDNEFDSKKDAEDSADKDDVEDIIEDTLDYIGNLADSAGASTAPPEDLFPGTMMVSLAPAQDKTMLTMLAGATSGSSSSGTTSASGTSGLLGGLGLDKIVGGAGGILGDTLKAATFQGSPIEAGLAWWAIASVATYLEMDDDITVEVILPDQEPTNYAVLDTYDPRTKEFTLSTDMSLETTDVTRAEPTAEGSQITKTGFVIANESNFTTTEEEPRFALFGVKSLKQRWDTKKKYKVETGESLEHFMMRLKRRPESEFTDKLNTFESIANLEFISSLWLDEEFPIDRLDAQEIDEMFHVQVNAIAPEARLPELKEAASCQLGTKTGSTGTEALPEIALTWNWNDFDIDTTDLYSCEVDSGDSTSVYCDATQFSTYLLKKMNALRNKIEGQVFNCPSTTGGTRKTQDTQSNDVGVTEVWVTRSGNDSIVLTEIENDGLTGLTSTANTPLQINVKISVTDRANTSNTATCTTLQSSATPVTGGSSGDYEIAADSTIDLNCAFGSLPAGTYDANVTLTVLDPNISEPMFNNTLTTVFAVGAGGTADCEPYKTTRLEDFLNASGLAANDKKEILDLVKFKVKLIQDKYTPDFQTDFDSYLQTTSFFTAPDWYKNVNTGLTKLFTDTEKFKFTPTSGDAGPEGYLLPGPGVYEVTIDMEFDNSNWTFVDSQGNIPETRIRLNKLDVPNPPSPFYYLPFDGPVGLSDGRVGYGVNYRGDMLAINEAGQANTLKTTEIPGSISIPQGVLSVTDASDDFKRLNVDARGTLLMLTRGAENQLIYTPSKPTPVIMEIQNTRENAWGFYSVNIDGGTFNTGSSQAKWDGIGYNCKDFDDKAVIESYFQTPDVHGLSATCALLSGTNAATSYGLEFCDPTRVGKVFFESIFYTPQDATNASMRIEVQNEQARLYTDGDTYSSDGSSGNQSITLDGITRNTEYNNAITAGKIQSIKDVFDLVENNFVCVSTSDARVEFWWNPTELSNELSTVKGDAQDTTATDSMFNDCILD